MRAAVFEQPGEPAAVLSVRDVELPVPGPGEVRVRMLAAPVNPSDLMTIRGTYGRTPPFPATPGYEGVGVVEAAGPGLLGRMLVGKRVASISRNGGTWAEHVIVAARQAIPLPGSLSRDEAAMFFVNPVTAWAMTRDVLAVPKGDWLLLTAAGSALGRMIIRLGKRDGFRTVAVVRREETAQQLRQEGADAVVVFDGDQQPPEHLRELVNEATGTDGVGYAVDPVGGPTGSAVVGCLGLRGRMLVYGTLDDQPLSFSPRLLIGRAARIEGFWLSHYMESLGLLSRLKMVRRIAGLVGDGTLRAEVAQSFPLEQVQEAIAASEQSGRSGKVLLNLQAE
ncbi:MAG: zinc-dependent alcohol dehydrogenase family protein [Planctomycetaceae bacterium]|nr:zinc-dependent alcohol dehydrogenase family protein [Planctomycetaceae bacterium]